MEKKQELTFDKLIPKGHDNAVTLETLVKITGMRVRHIKKIISDMTLNGTYVGNLLDGKGYFIFDLPKEKDLLERYLKQENARAYTTLKRTRKLQGELRKLNLGADLKAKRLLKGYTQKELAGKTKIELKRIREIEKFGNADTNEKRVIVLALR